MVCKEEANRLLVIQLLVLSTGLILSEVQKAIASHQEAALTDLQVIRRVPPIAALLQLVVPDHIAGDLNQEVPTLPDLLTVPHQVVPQAVPHQAVVADLLQEGDSLKQ